EAVTNILAADIARLGDIRLSANWMAACGEPGEDAALYDAVRAGGMELCPALGIAIPVGKDSLSMRTVWREGTTQKSVVAPVSLIVSAFAPVADVRRTLTPQLRTDAGATRLLWVDLGRGQSRIGASILAQVHGALGGAAPDLDEPALLTGFAQALRANARWYWPITTCPTAACLSRWPRWPSPHAAALWPSCRAMRPALPRVCSRRSPVRCCRSKPGM